MLWLTRSSVAAAFVVALCTGSAIHAAQMVRVDPVGDGAYRSWQDGNIASVGPRFNTYHELLEYQNLGNDAWTGTMQGDQLFGLYGVGISDPEYYPGNPMLYQVNGSTFTYLNLRAAAPGGDGEGPPPEGPANYLHMSISQTLYLEAYPQAWQHDPGNSLGTHDNDVVTLQHDYSCNTVNDATGGFILFRLDPVFNEQVGDVVPVWINTGTDAQVSHKYGNTGYTGYGEATTFILHNGQPVYVDESGNTQFNAAIGDIFAIKIDSMVYLRGSAVLEEPDSPFMYNRTFLPVHAMTWANCNIGIPLTTGAHESVPLMPDTMPTRPGDPYVFSGLDIGDSGLGIDSPLWIDPVVAEGFDFEIVGAKVTAVVLPDLWGDPDGFSIWYYDPDQDDWFRMLDNAWAGERADLPFAVNLFYIGSIDETLEVDPLNPTAFPVGLIFDGPATDVTVTMTPYVPGIPEPASLALLAIGGVAMLRRRG